MLVAVSAGHRAEAWRAGEEALEEVKRRLEVWKRDGFEGGGVGRWGDNRSCGAGMGGGHVQGGGDGAGG